jgi:hypothetical protein
MECRVLGRPAHQDMTTGDSDQFTAPRAIPVAKSNDASAPATRPSSVAWLKVPPVSGLECIRALRQEHFVICANLAGCVELQRGDLRLDVPLANPLDPMVLAAILQRAGITPTRFLELLDD